METEKYPTRAQATDFELEAQLPARGFLREVWDSLIYNRKWWLIPIVGFIILLGMLVMLSGTAAAPFIYSIF